MAYRTSLAGAIALAVACWALATALAIEKALADGVQSWAILLAYPVFTLAVGWLLHIGIESLKAWQLLKGSVAIALAFLALAVTLPASIGSSGGARDAAIATASKSAAEIAKIKADITETEKLVKQAQKWQAEECATGNGQGCEGKTFILEQRQRSLKVLKDELRETPAEKPATSGETRIAWVLGMAGYQVTADDVSLVWPMLPPLALELLCAFFWSLALGIKPPEPKAAAAKPTPKDSAQTSFDVTRMAALPPPSYYSPESPSPEPPPKPRKPRSKRKERVLAAIRAHTLAHGQPPAFSVVQSKHRLPKVTAHRYLKEAAKDRKQA